MHSSHRFWSKVTDDPSGCWIWTSATNNNGYGQFHQCGKTVLAHRISYELTHGPVKAGLVLDHLCRTPPCVNPAHLEPVTQLENMRRSAEAQKTHCVHGHEYTPENTGRHHGRRTCRECNRIACRNRSKM